MADKRRYTGQVGRRRGGARQHGALRRAGGAMLDGLRSYLRRSWQRRRSLSPQEGLILLAVAAVVGAFLLLLAQWVLWLAVLVGLTVLGFAWWELTRPR